MTNKYSRLIKLRKLLKQPKLSKEMEKKSFKKKELEQLMQVNLELLKQVICI